MTTTTKTNLTLSYSCPNNGAHYIIPVLLLLSGCAQQVAPTGGPKDTAPPKIVRSEPQNFSAKYTGDRLVLEFDEFVQLKGMQEQLIISPPLNEQAETRLRAKRLEIIFKDSLVADATYLVQFGSGIVDVNENNPLDSNVFVFSTGEFIDSLTLTGSVKNAVTRSPEKNVLVMLYPVSSADAGNIAGDSTPLRRKPLYFSKTKEKGDFKISYLKAGRYRIFALADANANYIYDQPGEKIAFLSENVDAGDSLPVELIMFEEASGKQYIKRSTFPHYGKLVVVFAQPVRNPKITPLNFSPEPNWLIQELNIKKDSMVCWLTSPKGLDSLILLVKDGQQFSDTVKLKMPSLTQMRGVRGGEQIKLTTAFNVSNGELFDIFSKLGITCSNPVLSVDTSKIVVMEKKDTIRIKAFYKDEIQKTIILDHTWKEEMSYEIVVLPGAIKDIFALENDTMKVSFKTRSQVNYSDLSVKITVPGSGKHIVQLLNNSDAVLTENTVADSVSTLQYEHKLPDKYRLKMIYDTNGNGQWDTGNYLKKIQPEKIIFYPETIELREGFDMETEWKIE